MHHTVSWINTTWLVKRVVNYWSAAPFMYQGSCKPVNTRLLPVPWYIKVADP